MERADEVFRDITAYLDFLRAKGCAVSVCAFAPELRPYLPVLYRYEAHTPPVCVYLKSCPETRRRCVEQKRFLLGHLPEGMRYGCCYAGVEEYLVPIRAEDGTRIVCVNVSGYRGGLARSAARHEALRSALPAAYEQSYRALETIPPTREQTGAMTAPLGYMFRALFAECRRGSVPENASDRTYWAMLDYFYEHYAQADAFSEVCRRLHYSEVYLRRLFREKSGTAPGAFLAELRMRRAAELLRGTDQPVTVVAAACGFEDSNYFSTLFRRRYGVPPREYRKEG